MAGKLKHIEKTDSQTAFSHVVKNAVDELNIRDYYKGADDLKIAKHVKELMQVLFANHHTSQQHMQDTQHTSEPSTELVVLSDISALPQIQNQESIQRFYTQLPKIIRNSPSISPHDRILCQTVFDLMIELKFNVYDDTYTAVDPLTERLTTTRVPDRKELRHYIDKKEKNKDLSRVGRHGSGHIEQLREHDVAEVPYDFGIDPSFKKKPLYRVIVDGVNKLSHTPFEYFHSYNEIKTNRGMLYLLRVYTHKDPSTSKDASIITLVNGKYNLLNSSFPVIDDSESNQLTITNFFGTYNVGHFAGGIFLRYKDELILIKNGRYALPGFAEQVVGKKFHTLKIVTGGFALSYEENPYSLYTDNYMRVIGKDMDEVQKLVRKLKEK